MSTTNENQFVERLAVSPAEAGRLLGLSRRTVYRLIRCQRIPSEKLGGRRVIPLARLAELIAGTSTIRATTGR